MKKAFIIIFSLVGLFVVLGAGYLIGNRVGQQTGAQQYTKKMWANNESQISTYSIFQKVNAYRERNDLEPLMLSDGLCKIANNEAQRFFDKSNSNYDPGQQQYNSDQQNAPESFEAFAQRAASICPECDLEVYNQASYVSLRPESCWNVAGKQVCEGDEEFGMMEKYTDRIVKLWSEDSGLKEVVYSPAQYGCVGAYGGAVILSVSDVTN
jgi:hypothetical protein